LTDIAAALGIHQLKKAERFRSRRQAIAEQYNKAFSDLPVILPKCADIDGLHSWHLYVLRLGPDTESTRDEFVESLYSQGIGCSVHYIPLHLQPYWANRYELTPEQFPVSQLAYERMASLPLYSGMTDGDVERVVRSVRGFFGCD
jgi:dTDP-4-amino-4,6-dideoxygalactose transaminase